jgi:hypothetical protein
MPGYLGANPEQESDEPGQTDSPLYQQALGLLAACVKRWQSEWNPGNYLTVDESMVKWTGKGEMH